MSLKISSYNKNFMRLAISLANERIGLTGSNPSVGCVIVKENEIISVGQTGINGIPHAEVEAIKSANSNLKNADIYISLEPCSHYGKTPPCTKEIIKCRFKNVFYGMKDVDMRSSGKAIKILNKKNIKVFSNCLYKDAKKLYSSYIILKKNNLPYIIGKIACSKNKIINSKNKYISNNLSLNFSHLLRYRNQGILISSKTINTDNPLLNCRLSGLDEFTPKRLILDKNMNIKIKSKIIMSSKKYETFIFYNKKNYKFQILKKYGIKLIYIPLNKFKNMDILNILIKIREIGINYLLVEGGQKLTNYFIKNSLFNEFFLFKSNKKIKEIKSSIKMSNIENKLSSNFKKKELIKTYLNNDKIIKFY